MSRFQCPAVAVTTLKHSGLITRCGCSVAPGHGLCHVHLARRKRGREVLVLDWSDEVRIAIVAVHAANAHQARAAELKALAEARMQRELEAIKGMYA